MKKTKWILPTALLLAACAGPPLWQKAEDGTTGIEKDRYACARIAEREMADAQGAYGDLYASGDFSSLDADRGMRYYSKQQFLFRDPYFDPGDARFRDDVYRSCLQERGWRPGGAG